MECRYMEVVKHIKELIVDGRLKSGSKVPSVRDICREFQCNKATVLRAFDELQKEHVLYSIPRSGYYVVEKGIKLMDEAADYTYTHSLCSQNPSLTTDGGGDIDFSSASPDVRTLPYQEFQRSLNQVVKIYENQLYSYPDIQGLPGLRKVMRKQLADTQVFTKEDNLFITSGTQQALYILSRMPFPNGKRNVLIEQPTFFGMIKALELNSIQAIGIERGIEGLDLDELERIFRNGDIKFFYITPRFHNPTGFSYSQEQKRHILHLAEKYDIYIVEDDYLGDLEMNSKNDPMFSMDLAQRVIYVKSYSKTLMPGIRISVAVLPSLLVNMFREYKSCCDIGTNIITQGVLEILLKSGMYQAHLKHIRGFYHEQMRQLEKACENTLLKEQLAVPQTGFFTCIRLNNSIKAGNLVNILQAKGVYTTAIREMFLPEFKKDTMIRLSICRANRQQIHKGLKIIADTLKSRQDLPPVRGRIDINHFV